MSSLSFPDINVWLAIAAPEHVHAKPAGEWWKQEAGTIAFSRFTQIGFLRLLTTAAAMDGKPLTIAEAWRVHDRFYEDDRVKYMPEPREVEKLFRERTTGHMASPKVWGDVWLLAVALAAEGRLVTFDAALATRGALCLVPRK